MGAYTYALVHNWLIAASGYTFNFKPGSNAPGGAGLQTVGNDAMEYALIVSGIGLLLCLATWGGGKGFQLERLASHGKEGALVCILVAFVAGLADAILQFAYNVA